LAYVKAPKKLPVFLRQRQISELLAAAERHDAETFALTREGKKDAPRYVPISGFVRFLLLTGMRLSEGLNLLWRDVDIEALEIRLEHSATKTGHGRVVALDCCPSLVAELGRMKAAVGEDAESQPVWQSLTRELCESTRKRLIRDYAAPVFTWHDLRRTCGTFLTCAPSIYGGASAFLSAKRLGHSVQVAEAHYAGALNGIDREAHTLEQAMGLEPLLKKKGVRLLSSPA
jgi:integrase